MAPMPEPCKTASVTARHFRRLQAPGRFYAAVRAFWQFAFGAAMRVKAHGLDHAGLKGGALLAVSHVSHLDPVVMSVLLKNPVSWMAREEFYRCRSWAAFLDRIGAFPINRHGKALPGVREALARLRRGEMVGIFPEGEIMAGGDSAVHGGPVRRGVALLAARAGV
ncbi:MAG: 1-acyl-sn-glycerol-3-phosphate acyltransferase, partial [Verrucomicrobiaceae bacterium]